MLVTETLQGVTDMCSREAGIIVVVVFHGFRFSFFFFLFCCALIFTSETRVAVTGCVFYIYIIVPMQI